MMTSIIITNNNVYTQQGILKDIRYTESTIRLTLEDESTEYVLFTKEILNLKKQDEITIYGKHDIYKGKEQIVVHKIIKEG